MPAVTTLSRIAIAAGLLAGLLACGDGTTDDGAGPARPSAPTVVASVPALDGGCTARHPTSVPVELPYSAWVTACTDAVNDLAITNVTSASVLVVSTVQGAAQLVVGAAPQDGLAQSSVALVAPGGLYESGSAQLPPGATLVVTSTSVEPAVVDMYLDPTTTAQALAAVTAAEYLEERLGTRAQRLQSAVVACAESAAAYADRAAISVEEFLRTAYGAGTACPALFAEARKAGAPAQNAADDALRVADSAAELQTAQWRTFFRNAGRVLVHLAR